MKLVSWLHISDDDSVPIVKAIEKQQVCVRINKSTYLVGGGLSYVELRDALSSFKPKKLLVIPFEYDRWATYECSPAMVEFLRKNESRWD